jgi:hypothetical protein
MTNNIPSDPTQQPAPIKHYVLLMTAAVIACDAQNEMDAAQQALIAGPQVLDPSQLQWVVKFVDTKPIYLGEEGEDEPNADTPEPTKPKIELIK